ncbi:hypothetical protein FTUN_5701 [Frigoriglobus tundricola]|uniref:RNA polymerase sigma-70 region 2 domain-containing protein n=1 Tax=Frigoriglobus tundricola TaxID=2774151 RepID=A0A6M5YY11_9BACT|nr:hypothetical protein FTUN_5701 [Frigoriglobus tundricola]
MPVNHNRLRYLSSIPPAGVPDEDLLARWVTHGDEAAFELLVRRYAPMVLAACRRLLRDPADADDAFQAAFLVLARKAGSVARGAVLAAWLHRVAVRAALRVRADRRKRTDLQAPGRGRSPARPVTGRPGVVGTASGAGRGNRAPSAPAPCRVRSVLPRRENGRRGRPAARLPGRDRVLALDPRAGAAPRPPDPARVRPGRPARYRCGSRRRCRDRAQRPRRVRIAGRASVLNRVSQ